ncbi:MAG: NAD(P)H-dependent oxidoreductase [Pseudomonadota bacterium]
MRAYFTPPDAHTPQMKATPVLSNMLAAQVLEADGIVVGRSIHDYNVPALLKALTDHIARAGMTLGLDGKGVVTGTKATVNLAAGGACRTCTCTCTCACQIWTARSPSTTALSASRSKPAPRARREGRKGMDLTPRDLGALLARTAVHVWQRCGWSRRDRTSIHGPCAAIIASLGCFTS